MTVNLLTVFLYVRWIIDANIKKSKFNIFVPYENDETIVFNTLTGAIGRLNKETYQRFVDNNLTDVEIEVLSKKGIFVPKDFDEMKKINADRIAGINDDGEKHFRIWPTSACNARCYYCFEKGIKTTTMTMDVADKVVKHISEKLNNGDLLRIE